VATSERPETVKLTYVRVMAAEWLKLRTHRGFAWATVTAVIVSALMSALGGYLVREDWTRDPAGALTLATSAPSVSIAITGLIFGLGLCTWITKEFVSGSNYLTLMAVPRRHLVFSARLGLTIALSVIFGGVTALIGSVAALLFFGSDRMTQVVSEGAFWANAAMTVLVCACMMLLYFAAATLTRRSLPAVGLIAVLFFVMPNISGAVSLLDGPRVLSILLGYFPGSLVSQLLTVPSDGVTSTLTPLTAAVLLVSWSVLLVMVSARRFARYE